MASPLTLTRSDVSKRVSGAVEEGDWTCIKRWMASGQLSYQQIVWVIVEIIQYANTQQFSSLCFISEFSQHIRSICSSTHIDSVMTQLISEGLWEGVLSLSLYVEDENRKWEVGGRTLDNKLLHLVAKRRWNELSIVLHEDPHKFSECILPVCGDRHMDLLMTHLISEGQGNSIQKLLLLTEKQYWEIEETVIQREKIQLAAEERWIDLAHAAYGSSSHSLLAWVVQEMCKRAGQNELLDIVGGMCNVDQIPCVLENVMKRGFINSAAKLLCRLVAEVVRGWADGESGTKSYDAAEFWSMVRNLSFDVKVVSELCMEVHKKRNMWDLSYERLGNIVFNSVVDIVLVSLCNQQDRSTAFQSVSDQMDLIEKNILEEIRTGDFANIQRLCTEFSPATRTKSITNPLFALSCIRAVMVHCSEIPDIETILSTFPVVPSMLCAALRAGIEEISNQDIICLPDMSHIPEAVRRELFQAYVYGEYWNVVKQWADHTLHDDQRIWALKKAYKEKQWDVVLDLSGDGLTEDEVIRMHYFVARYADWNIVLDMYKREADMSEVKELLTIAARATVRTDEKQELTQRICQLGEVEANMTCRMKSFKTLESAVEQGEWQLVLLTIHQRPAADSMRLALKAAVAREAWHVVIQLFRLGMHTFDEPSFFHEMIEKQQWRVCRVMIEQGLNSELYVDVITKLMELNQWSLVAKMMEHDVEDAVRRRVMQCAMERKQGTVVSQSIKGLKQRLTLQEREDLFHKAIVYDVLQAVRPLVGEKDDTGVRHRDLAMLYAIRRQHWDIVDLCRHHHANIDMLDEQGNTPALFDVQQGPKNSVMALIKRGADPSLLGSERESVFHMAILSREWECVKLLITYPCQMQQTQKYLPGKRTPLEMLIKSHQLQIIEHAILHCSAQWKGVNCRGETALHTVSLAGIPSIMRSLLDQGVDPLLLTNRGHSALSYAVLSKNPQKMVAECVSLGFTTHQPHITERITSQRGHPLLSPVLLAVMRGLPEVTQLLYESGSCSFKELFQVLPELVRLADPSTLYTCSLMKPLQKETSIVYSELVNDIYDEFCNRAFDNHVSPINRPRKSLIRKSAVYLMEVSSTPRSLMSMCRLVISRCLRICGSRDRDISQLPLSNPLKDYVSFSDLLPADDGQSAHSGTDEAGTDDDDNKEDDYMHDEQNPFASWFPSREYRFDGNLEEDYGTAYSHLWKDFYCGVCSWNDEFDFF